MVDRGRSPSETQEKGSLNEYRNSGRGRGGGGQRWEGRERNHHFCQRKFRKLEYGGYYSLLSRMSDSQIRLLTRSVVYMKQSGWWEAVLGSASASCAYGERVVSAPPAFGIWVHTSGLCCVIGRSVGIEEPAKPPDIICGLVRSLFSKRTVVTAYAAIGSRAVNTTQGFVRDRDVHPACSIGATLSGRPRHPEKRFTGSSIEVSIIGAPRRDMVGSNVMNTSRRVAIGVTGREP